MRRSLAVSLVGIVVLAVSAVVVTTAAKWSPQLGLDLQGGASVVLQPTREVKSDVLDQSIEIIRNRVDALGVAEPDISRQGEAIVVQLPGVEDQQRALDLVGQTAELRFRPVIADSAPPELPTTSRDDDKADAQVVLPQKDDSGRIANRYALGPVVATGQIIRTAQAVVNTSNGQWQVDFKTTGAGKPTLAQITSDYLNQRLAMVLDGVVVSAPGINVVLPDGEGEIIGDFTKEEAKNLALVLRFGALPVELAPQTVRTVSPTLGQDSLRAGLVAGLCGLALVLAYMVFYYRALGLVVLLGLLVWAALQWSVISLLGETQGLALTLAGATGIVVSVGVTVDSYVVFFERLKDEIRSGRTLRSSVERGFSRAFRTILAADTSSFIGAALLYLLTVGPVRGFAFFLGLATILDLIVAFFFTRPMVVLVSRSRVFTEARWLGVTRGLAMRPAGVA